ncbi:MAG: sigma-70 family RNA polymerase sigma factor [Verrucomicrobia bacterium]|nr:sigma-70 family RNA polymerase sigma factor [Verrucomicrobiota bacterium]
MSRSDLELLDSYARERTDDAFAEIVRRHVNIVYGAALRQVRSPQLAEEVAQCVFLELACQANHLSTDTILAAWLYKVTHRISVNLVRGEIRRQVREQTALEMNDMDANTTAWNEIEPLLDEGMHSLEESDRAALLLRYFENKSLREVGQFFGASEDAAQKRVSRAVDRLREFFTRRGVTIGASSLVVMISANAAQAAPVGLSAAITTAAALGNTIATTATATTTKAIVMTTLQKTIATTVVILLCGTSAVLVSSKITKGSKSSESVAADLDNYVGQFEMIDHKIEIKKRANGLAVNIDGNPAFVAYPKSVDKFASHDHNSLTELTFVRDALGRATQFALVRDGRKLGDLKRSDQ